MFLIFIANATFSCIENTPVNLTCTTATTLHIVQATYSDITCAYCSCPCNNCSVTSTVVSLCATLASCSFTVTNSLFFDPCFGHQKTFALVYYCGWTMYSSFDKSTDLSKARFHSVEDNRRDMFYLYFLSFLMYEITATHFVSNRQQSLFARVSLRVVLTNKKAMIPFAGRKDLANRKCLSNQSESSICE